MSMELTDKKQLDKQVNKQILSDLVTNSGVLPKLTTLAVLIGQWQLEHISFRRFDVVIEEQVPVVINVPRVERFKIGTQVVKAGALGIGGVASGADVTIPLFDTRTVIEQKTVLETRKRTIKKNEFKYLSTEEISDLRNTGLSPPILTTAARLADATADTAIAALKAAEGFIDSISNVQAPTNIISTEEQRAARRAKFERFLPGGQ